MPPQSMEGRPFRLLRLVRPRKHGINRRYRRRGAIYEIAKNPVSGFVYGWAGLGGRGGGGVMTAYSSPVASTCPY